MKMSIIVATYNNESTLGYLLDSIAKQSYNNIELIIMDGMSKDATLSIIKEYEKIVSYFESELDTGVYSALNKGLKHATGDYVYFIGADDMLFSVDVIEKVVKKLEIENYPIVLCGNVWQVDAFSHYQTIQSASEAMINWCTEISMPHHQGMFIKSNIAKKIKFDEKYKIAADYDMFHKIIKLYGGKAVKCIDFPIAYFNLGTGTSSHLDIGMREYVEIMEKNNFPRKGIEKYKSTNNIKKYKINKFIKTVIPLELNQLIKKIKGWEKHCCDWDKCQWGE